ncbi:retrovirus-related Pol polyprotein from transposon 17.6 [Trichonephila clavipes]|nr:retrovirus-related Pol polyprotein from transposon 17.6 [Trichonephila clavipes]
MCIDYRKLNQKLVKDKFPLPIIEDVFRHFARSKEPTTINQVQSFLGLTGYFHKYIKDYSKIAKPLSDLARERKPLCFGTQQKEAFEKLKKIMSEGPILHLYKYGRETELHRDAYTRGTAQFYYKEAEDGKLHPFYYMSKKTNTAEEKYDSYELEVLAIINALKKFRVYLLGQHFKIVTDCSSISEDYAKKELITRIARWALQLEEFDYEIEHRAGSRMKQVDALSRYTVMISTHLPNLLGYIPVKTVSAESALEKLKQQQKTFGNPIRIISDRGSAFTSKLFNDYCDEEEHSTSTNSDRNARRLRKLVAPAWAIFGRGLLTTAGSARHVLAHFALRYHQSNASSMRKVINFPVF